MLVATNLGRLGQDEPTFTAEDQVQAPAFQTTLTRLRSAEDDLQVAYSNIATAAAISSDIPVDILRDYNNARQSLLEGAADWLELRKRYPNSLPDPGAEPTPPPMFDIGELSGYNGLGQAIVPTRSVNVIWGPRGKERVLPLGDPMARELGAIPAAIVQAIGIAIVLLGVAIVFWVISIVIREWSRAAVESNRAKAIQAQMRAQAIRSASEGFLNTVRLCVGTSQDPAHRLKCIQESRGAYKAILDAMPKAPGDETGLGFFGWIGVAVVVGGVAYGGYYLFKRRRDSRDWAPPPPRRSWPDAHEPARRDLT